MDEGLQEKTGSNLGDWFWGLVNACILGAIGYGGVRLLLYAMSVENVPLTIVGIVIACAGFGGAYGMLRYRP